MVDWNDLEGTLKPLIDGGPKAYISLSDCLMVGFYCQARLIIPTQTSYYECSLDILAKRTVYPVCTIATTLARGKEFDITGITYSLTQGDVKNIIPAITSTNAIIAGLLQIFLANRQLLVAMRP
jgi:NEDD8-activating enzyme E1